MLVFYVALGGAIGAAARYWLSDWIRSLAGGSFPWGTLIVNVAGSLLTGFAIRSLEAVAAPPRLRALLTIGVLGGFTTFSTFGYETAALLEDGEWPRAALYSLGSLGLAAAFVGFFLAALVLEPNRSGPVHNPIQSATLPAAILCATLVACGGADAPPGARPDAPRDTSPDAPPAARDARTTTVRVYFTRDEEPVPVDRTVPDTASLPRAAIEALLAGPTADERTAGLTSFFSSETAEMLNDVTVDAAGNAVVDFRDLRRIIPNASSSFGSRILLGELDATVFQFPNIARVEYRIDGSCEAFWEWLQYGGCQVAERPR